MELPLMAIDRAACRRTWATIFIGVVVLSTPCSSSSPASWTCSEAFPSCSCEVAGSCGCNFEFGRCVCRDEVAALLGNGKCIETSSARALHGGQRHGNCSQDQSTVSLLLVVGTVPSPEVQMENLRTGHPSFALVSILHWSVASALALASDKLSVSGVKLIADTVAGDQGQPGLLFFDISLTICAPASEELAPAGVFEKRFIQSWQEFAAFPVTTVRVLELKTDAQDSNEESRHPPPRLPPVDDTGASNVEDDPSLGWKELFWLFPAGGLAVILFIFTVWRLLRLKCSKNARDSPRHWRDVAPTAQLQQHQLEAQTWTEGPGGGTLATVAYDFDPLSDDGCSFATCAGLDGSECLKVGKNDLLEVFAQGEGWLYCRRSGDGIFGYVPEQCVCWMLGEHSGASRAAPTPPLVAGSQAHFAEASSMPSPEQVPPVSGTNGT